MSINPTRRRFLQSSFAAAATLASTPLLRGVPTGYSANERVNVAQIGATGKGHDDLNGVSRAGGNIVALCDVDANHTAQAAHEFPKARRHTDFRKMLETQKDIDAVVVTIPDHQHAFAAMTAMRHGKHVYCQKPLTHDIYEARLLRQTARQLKLATQMGNEGHSSEGLRAQVDWVRAGVIGPVKEVHVWTDRPVGWWPQGLERPTDAAPVPPSLDWDLWLGTAPERPYNPAYHPFKWRGFWDFGTGALGDMACHIVDVAFWALNLGGSCTVEAESQGMTSESGPNWSIITWQFPARGDLPPVKMKWYDGGKRADKPAEMPAQQWLKAKGGCMFVGEKGIMCGALMQRPNVLGELGRDLTPPPRTLPRSPGHYVEWIEAIKGGPAALSNFDYAARLTETILLGNIALRCGKTIEWDPAEMKVTNVPEANGFVRREYRKGWAL